jgi:hypothetical protein
LLSWNDKTIMTVFRQYALGSCSVVLLVCTAHANPNALVEQAHVAHDVLTHQSVSNPTEDNQVKATSITATEAALKQQALQQQLAQHAQWRRLLYFPDQVIKAEKSRVTDQVFFNASNGNQNPEQELEATLAGLFHPVAEADQSVACRFPARRTWLAQQLNIHADQIFPKANCPTYDRWINEVKPYQATLIFASDYLGNPSSMFGHTLLRIDQEKKSHTALVSYAINYSAQTATENSASFVWRGLTGGYPAAFSMMPYFEKVKEYGALESRDLWEYPLNLSPEETLFLVNHTWEMRDVKFPYYFLSKNCSYELLGLLDVARPSLKLQQQFQREVIPAQTVKALAQHTDLIREVIYRPALDTQLQDQSSQYGKKLSTLGHQLAENPATDLSSLSATDQAKIQEIAYDDLYVRFMARDVSKQSAQPRLRQLLVARSQNSAPIQRRELPIPAINPATGHDAARVQLGGGQSQQQSFASLEWRIAYHDLLDPIGGYRAGSQMDFLRAKIKYQHDRLKLDTLDIIHIDALTPISVFSQPKSWGIKLGWQQEPIDSTGQFSETDDHGVFNIQGQLGYAVGDPKQTLCYAQAQALLQFAGEFKDNVRAGLGPRVGCAQQITANSRALLNVTLPYWSDQQAWALHSQLGVQVDVNRQFAFRISGDYRQQKQKDFSGFEASFIRYF